MANSKAQLTTSHSTPWMLGASIVAGVLLAVLGFSWNSQTEQERVAGNSPALHEAQSQQASDHVSERSSPQPQAVEVAAQSTPDKVVSIALVGDILLRGTDNPFRDDYVRSLLKSADVTVGNLENPFSERGRQTPLKFRGGRLINNEFLFRAKPVRAQSLRNAGFDVVSLANNHIMDYGAVALQDTFLTLQRNGIRHAGAGENLSAARQPAIVKRDGVSIAFLSYIQSGDDMLPGTKHFAATENEAGAAFVHRDRNGSPTPASLKMIRSDIASAKEQADLVAVSYHWGRERHSRPSVSQRRLAHRTVEAGADFIVGHHSHCLQGIEVYGGKPIFYSLGNFVFKSFDSLTKRTGIARLSVDRQGVRRILFHPARIRTIRPYRASRRESQRIAARMRNLSRSLGTSMYVAPQDGWPVAALDLRESTSKAQASARMMPNTRLASRSRTSAASAGSFIEVTRVVPNIRIDLRYATTDNFLETKLYEVNRAFLRPATAAKLKKAQSFLAKYGLRLKVWDAYRPLSVQRRMWDKVSDRRYVASPATGSNHNRGAAVDVTLVNRKGQELPMPTGYDDFSSKAHINYRHPNEEVRRNVYWLRQAMTGAGFRTLSTEWWHFDDTNASRYPVADVSLSNLVARSE